MKKWSIFISVLCNCVIPFAVVFPIVMSRINVHGRLFAFINDLLNTRLFASRVYLDVVPVTLFGSEVAVEGFALDNSYLNALLYYGIVPFVFLMLLYFLTLKNYVTNKKGMEVAILVTFWGAGVAEPFLYNKAFKNITLLFMGNYLFDCLQRHANSWKRAIIPIGEKTIELKIEQIYHVGEKIRMIRKKVK